GDRSRAPALLRHPRPASDHDQGYQHHAHRAGRHTMSGLFVSERPASWRRSGQSMVEMALLLPILTLLLLGVIEFGFILYAHVQLANAAREAGRAASLYRSTR